MASVEKEVECLQKLVLKICSIAGKYLDDEGRDQINKAVLDCRPEE